MFLYRVVLTLERTDSTRLCTVTAQKQTTTEVVEGCRPTYVVRAQWQFHENLNERFIPGLLSTMLQRCGSHTHDRLESLDVGTHFST